MQKQETGCASQNVRARPKTHTRLSTNEFGAEHTSLMASLTPLFFCLLSFSSFTAQVLDNPWDGEPLPPNAAIPEKPLVTEKKKCVIQ